MFYYDLLELDPKTMEFEYKEKTNSKEYADIWILKCPHFRTWHEKEDKKTCG